MGEAEDHRSLQRLVCKRKRISNPYGEVFFLLTRPLMGDPVTVTDPITVTRGPERSRSAFYQVERAAANHTVGRVYSIIFTDRA